MSRNSFRKHLSMPGMLNEMRACFDCIPDPIKARDFSLPECLMSGLAVFSLKMPSLLQFDTQVRGGEDPVQARNLRTLFGAKPGDHDLLFSWFEASETKETWERRDRKTGTVHRFEWDHGLPLNDANFELKVNMLKYEETDTKGKTQRFSWVTDLPLDRETVMPVMRAARRAPRAADGPSRTKRSKR